jgi:hypothetical protein
MNYVQSILSLLLEFSASRGQVAKEIDMDTILKSAVKNENAAGK